MHTLVPCFAQGGEPQWALSIEEQAMIRPFIREGSHNQASFIAGKGATIGALVINRLAKIGPLAIAWWATIGSLRFIAGWATIGAQFTVGEAPDKTKSLGHNRV